MQSEPCTVKYGWKALHCFAFMIFKKCEIQYKNITNQDTYKIMVTK